MTLMTRERRRWTAGCLLLLALPASAPAADIVRYVELDAVVVLSATVSYLTATDGAGLRLGTEQDSKRHAADHERIAYSEPFRFSLGR